MSKASTILRSHRTGIAILAGIGLGCCLGLGLGERAAVLRPVGEAFLNLLLTAVVPAVFFSVASAVASMSDLRRLGRILGWMLAIFVATGVVSSLLMLGVVSCFLPLSVPGVAPGAAPDLGNAHMADQLVRAFTVADFSSLLSARHMLALIVFAGLTGLATASTGEKAEPFRRLLAAGDAVMSRLVGFIMVAAPVGLGAWFAHLVGTLGPQLLGSYGKAVMIYYPVALGYFFVGFTAYAWIAAGNRGVEKFWSNILAPAVTAWGTGSSLATIPTNLEAARRVGVPRDIYEIVIPVGATIHMDGSCISAILKIALLFGFYGRDFDSLGTVISAVVVALLAGTVISGIPSGGVLGEVLILSLYGFPPEALPLITMIGTLVDPPATLVNAVGDNVASMMVARALGGKGWIDRPPE